MATEAVCLSLSLSLSLSLPSFPEVLRLLSPGASGKTYYANSLYEFRETERGRESMDSEIWGVRLSV